MLPPDPMIAFSQTKAMIAERQADSARQRSVAAARKDAGRSPTNPIALVAHRLVTAFCRLPRSIADHTQPVPPTVSEKPGSAVG